jgi:hypothetical protein
MYMKLFTTLHNFQRTIYNAIHSFLEENRRQKMQSRLENCLKGMKNKRDVERKQELYLKHLGNYD